MNGQMMMRRCLAACAVLYSFVSSQGCGTNPFSQDDYDRFGAVIQAADKIMLEVCQNEPYATPGDCLDIIKATIAKNPDEFTCESRPIFIVADVSIWSSDAYPKTGGDDSAIAAYMPVGDRTVIATTSRKTRYTPSEEVRCGRALFLNPATNTVEWNEAQKGSPQKVQKDRHNVCTLRVAAGACIAANLSLNWSTVAMAQPRTGRSEPDQKIVDPPMADVSKERFLWHLGPPPYPETSLEDLFVNGSSIDDDATIPWVRCGTCKDGVYCFGNPRVLPYECPAELRPLLRKRGPLPRAEWERLVGKFNAHNEGVGRKSVITPGCTFPHFKWKVPSRPDGDVFWPFLAPPIVSARLRELLELHNFRGVSFHRVRVDYAGSLNPKARPLPTDNAEEMFDACPCMDAAARNQLEFYSFVVPTAPNNMMFCVDFCPECKEVRAGEATQGYERRSRYWEKHRTNKTIPRHATLDTDVFVAWPFQGLIVSERAAKIFESLKLGNIAISKIQVLDETPRESLQRLLEEEKKDGEK